MRVLALVILSILLLPQAEGAAQTYFGLEVNGGQSVGLNSYIKDTVYVSSETPYLADESPGWGATASIRFLITTYEIFVDTRFFHRQTLELHHIGDRSISADRQRSDGTWDDAGITYTTIDAEQLALPSRQRGSLRVFSSGVTYRATVSISARYSLYIPVSGGLGLLNVAESNRPWKLGALLGSGLGGRLQIAGPVAIVGDARVWGVLSSNYLPLSDSSRAAYYTGRNTESTLFSAFSFLSGTVGLQWTIR